DRRGDVRAAPARRRCRAAAGAAAQGQERAGDRLPPRGTAWRMTARAPWWKRGYGRLGAVLGVIGVVFTLAQLPVSVAGFPGPGRTSLNGIAGLSPSSPDNQTGVGRIGPFRFEGDPSPQAAVKAFGRADSRRREPEGFECHFSWTSRGLDLGFVSS